MKTIVYIFFFFNIYFAKPENYLSKTKLSEYYELITESLTENLKLSVESSPSGIVENVEVNTDSGKIIGVTYPEAHAFYSIPYGQAPIGDLRFKPPVKAIRNETFNASTENFISCFVFLPESYLEPKKDYFTEDCLVLNVDVPSSVDLSTSHSEQLPVMVWIHGGAFFAGAGTSKFYDARFLSNITNTIVVTVNYRLGPFGFLVYEDEEDSFQGNQGIKDQQLALEWVRDNIEYFGGNKDMVTIFGQSAGAQSATLHLMSETSKPLFKRAIMQSNPVAFYQHEKSEAKMKAEALLNKLSCRLMSPMECLKSLPPEDFIDAHIRVALSNPLNIFNVIEPYRPVIDDEFPEQPLTYFRSGKWQNNKEVIIGTTSEEAAYIYSFFKKMNLNLFTTLTNFVVGREFASNVVDEYLKLVDIDDDNYNYNKLFVQEVSDMLFVCPSRLLARFMSATSSAESDHPAVYVYINNHPLECGNLAGFCGYPFHGADIPFVFNNGPLIGYVFSENDTIVTNMFNTFWGNFAYTGKPTDDLSIWPYYTEEALFNPTTARWRNIRIQAPNSFVESEYSKDICDFWDNLGLYIAPNLTQTETTSPSIVETTLPPIVETTKSYSIETTLGSIDDTTTTGTSVQISASLSLTCVSMTLSLLKFFS